jgi:hypothetical protein
MRRVLRLRLWIAAALAAAGCQNSPPPAAPIKPAESHAPGVAPVQRPVVPPPS